MTTTRNPRRLKMRRVQLQGSTVRDACIHETRSVDVVARNRGLYYLRRCVRRLSRSDTERSRGRDRKFDVEHTPFGAADESTPENAANPLPPPNVDADPNTGVAFASCASSIARSDAVRSAGYRSACYPMTASMMFPV